MNYQRIIKLVLSLTLGISPLARGTNLERVERAVGYCSLVYAEYAYSILLKRPLPTNTVSRHWTLSDLSKNSDTLNGDFKFLTTASVVVSDPNGCVLEMISTPNYYNIQFRLDLSRETCSVRPDLKKRRLTYRSRMGWSMVQWEKFNGDLKLEVISEEPSSTTVLEDSVLSPQVPKQLIDTEWYSRCLIEQAKS